MLLLSVQSKYWNGCLNFTQDFGSNICYKSTPPMTGYEAWENCVSMNLSRILDSRNIPERIVRVLQQLTMSDTLEEHKSIPGGRPLWVNAIQAYPGAKTYVTYGNRHTLPVEMDGPGPHCLAMTLSPSGGVEFQGHNCSENFRALCMEQDAAFEAKTFDASAPEACNHTRALSVLPPYGCFLPEEACPPEAEYYVHVRPKWFLFQDFQTMRIGKGMSIVILQIEDKFKENETLTNSTKLCYIGTGTNNKIKLQLRHNVTTRGLSLWVGSPGRAEWPPRCVGGRVKEPDGDPRALRVHLVTGPAASPVVWCYTRDILNGRIAVSNRIFGLTNKTFDSCPDANGTRGPPSGTVVDEKASCLRCLEQVVHPCVEDIKDCTSCTEEHCGRLGLTFAMWNRSRYRNQGFEEFRICAQHRECLLKVIWDITEGGDCNGDGVFDCDDRFIHFFNPACTSVGTDPRSLIEGELYWKCNTDLRRDFVDLPTENGTARYYCLNYLDKGRQWSEPQYITEDFSYLFLSTSDPLAITNNSDIIQERMTEEIHSLQLITIELPPNQTLTMNQTEEIIGNFSRLLDVSGTVLRNAQRDANVSSLPELLETILIRAPANLTFTTPNLAVSKKQAIGFQLISEKPVQGLVTFGENPRQIPITSRENITTDKVEAAVILPNISEKTTMVVVTFAKGSDFTSCQGPANSRSANGIMATNFNNIPGGNGSIPAARESDGVQESAQKQTNVQMNKFGEKCTFRKNLETGCLNTHVVQVGLLDRNGSYVQLPEGESVDIILRTKSTPMLGQTKKCVYWKPQEGGWASDGCELVEGENDLDICRCSHLTHFAQLVTTGDAVHGPHKDLLNTLSICACGISLLGLIGVILAGIFVRSWRKKTENKVLLNLAAAMTLYMGLFLWSALRPNRPELSGRCPVQEPLSIMCQVAGAALHYSVLSSFCWMLMAAVTHYLRFTTFTGPRGVSHFGLKTSLIGWGVPVVPVAALMAVDAETYAGRGRDFCYPTGVAFYSAVLAPILIVLLINGVIFILIIRLLFPRCCLRNDYKPRHTSYDERRVHIRKVIVSFAFTLLFGLTWYLGLMAFTVVPAYIFCAVMAIQGPALLIFFVFGERNIRDKLTSMKKRIEKSETGSTSGWTGSTTSTAVLAGPSKIGGQARRKLTPIAAVNYSVNVKKPSSKREDDTTL